MCSAIRAVLQRRGEPAGEWRRRTGWWLVLLSFFVVEGEQGSEPERQEKVRDPNSWSLRQIQGSITKLREREIQT